VKTFNFFYCRDQACTTKTTATTTICTQSYSVHPPSKSPLLISATAKATNNKRKSKCNNENVDLNKNYSPSKKSKATIQRTRIPREVKRVLFLG
jgi:hypothetical protein